MAIDAVKSDVSNLDGDLITGTADVKSELKDWMTNRTDILQTKMSNDGGNDLAAIHSEVDTNVTNIQASLQSLDSKIGMMDTVSQRTLFQ